LLLEEGGRRPGERNGSFVCFDVAGIKGKGIGVHKRMTYQLSNGRAGKRKKREMSENCSSLRSKQ